MPDLLIRGVISCVDATSEPRSIWVESDAVVRLRIANEPVPETAEPSDLLTRADFSEMSYKVYRLVDGVDALVEGYENVAITVDDVIPADGSLPRDWGKDGVGYNFRHVVPAAAFAANCVHKVVYRFVSDGVTTHHCVTIHVDGPTGEVGTAGSGTVTGNPGTPGTNGTNGAGYRATSTSSVAVGTSIRSFITQTGLAYTTGARVRVTSTADTSIWMEGLVSTYTSGILVVNVDLTSGSGTLASWNINLAGEPGLGAFSPVFNVMDPDYGAVGNANSLTPTDDTLAFQAVIADAETHAALVGRAQILIPPSKAYLVGDVSIALVPSLDVPSAPLHFSTTARNIDVWGYGATLKLSDFGASNSVVRLFGARIRVLGLKLNLGCAAGTLAIKGCSGFEVNGSLDEGVQGTDCEFIDCECFGGFFDQDDPNQGQEHFVGVNCTRAKWVRCFSEDSGWTAFRSSGDDEQFIDCTAIEYRGNGFRINDGTTVRLANCTALSAIDSGRSAYLVDAGSAGGYPVKRRTRVDLINCNGYTAANDPNESGSSLLKLAAADEVNVDGGTYYAEHGKPSSPNTAIRLEDNLRRVVLQNISVRGVMLFTPSQFDGAVSAHASGWSNDGTAGFAQFTLPAGHGITAGDTIFIQDSSINSYNRPHNIQSDSSGSKSISLIANNGSGNCRLTVAAGHNAIIGHTLTVSGSGVGAYNTTHTVTAITATTIDTNRAYVSDSSSGGMACTNSASPVLITSEIPYTAGSLGSAYAHEGVDEVRMRKVSIRNSADTSYTLSNYIIETVHCRIFDLEDVTLDFSAVHNAKRACIGWSTPDVMLDLFRMKDVRMSGDTDKIFQGVKILSPLTGTDEQQRITVINNGGSPGGSFTLSCGSLGPTGAITWNANTATMATNIQTALRLLSGFSVVSVTYVSGDYTAGAIFNVNFRGTVGNLTQLTSADSLTGSVHSIAHSTVTQGVVSSALTTSGKTICLNSAIVNRGTGTTWFISPYQEEDFGTPYADRSVLFNSTADKVGRYAAAAVPATAAVGWNQGDKIENATPGPGATPGWRCVATTAAGTSPSFQQEAALA